MELPTLALFGVVCACWLAVVLWADALGPAATIALMALLLAQHSSLQHEILHGHPFRSRNLNEALAFAPLGLLVPYERFRDTHLAHHRDARLTDPYDDPESNYLDPKVWAGLSRPARALYRANNTLAGRMILGPAIGMTAFVRSDLALIRGGDRAVARAWALHFAGLAPLVLFCAAFGSIAWWEYLAGAYGALSLLKIRTFAEHRAHEAAAGRSVIIEDRGPLALLFLNNNLHAVHHAHPSLPWYRLPAAYASRREEFLRRNRFYRYASYTQLFARHLYRAKDPVAHPLWSPPAPEGGAADAPH